MNTKEILHGAQNNLIALLDWQVVCCSGDVQLAAVQSLPSLPSFHRRNRSGNRGIVIQQLRAHPTNPPPPLRAAFQKPVTEGAAFKALTKYTGNHPEYHDWSFSARRVLTRADKRFAGPLQWIYGQIDEVEENDVLEYRRTTDLSSTDLDWLNSEVFALLVTKTSDTAMASIKSLEEVEVKGIIGWQRLEREARGYHRHRVALLTESVTHPERVLKVTDLPQAFHRWESSLKEFQRGRPAELDDDVKANAMRHMMPTEIRTFSEIRDYMLQQARQRADVYVGDVCHSTKKVCTVTPRVSTTTPTLTATKTTTPVPMDVSQMSSNVSKPETEEQEVSRTNTSKTRNVMETKCLQSRARAKVVSRNLFHVWNERTHR